MILDNQTNQEENTQQQPQQPQQQPALTRETVLSRFSDSNELMAAVSELDPNEFAGRYSPENPRVGRALWYDVNEELKRQSIIALNQPTRTETTRKPEYANFLPSWVPFIGGEYSPEAVSRSLVKENIGDFLVRSEESIENSAITIANLFSSDDNPNLNMRGLTKKQTVDFLKAREDYIAKSETMGAYSKYDRDKTAEIVEKQQKIEKLQEILALSNDEEERKRAEAHLKVLALTPEEEAYTKTKAFNDIKEFVGIRDKIEQYNKLTTMNREFWGLNNPKMAHVDDPENLPDVLRKIRGMVADTSGLLVSSAAIPGTAIAGVLPKVLGLGKATKAIYAGSNPIVNTGFRLFRPSTWPSAAKIGISRALTGDFIKLAIGGTIKHVGGATLSTLPLMLEEAKENEITTIGQRFENGVPASLEVEDKIGMLAAAWINDVGTVMFPKLPFVPRWFKSTGLESASNKILQSVEKNWPKISSKALQETFGKGTSLTKAIQAQVAAESMAVLGKYGKGIASSEINALTKFIGTLTQDSIALGLTTFAQQAIKDLSARGYLKADQFVENWLDYFSGGDYSKNVKEAMYAGLMSVALAGRGASAEFLNDTRSAFKFPNLRRKQAYLNSEMWNSAETVEYDKIAEKLNGNRITSAEYNKNYSDILDKVKNHDIDGLVQKTGYSQKYIEDIIDLSTPNDVASELTDSLGISDKRAQALKDYQDTLVDTQHKKEVDGQFSKTPIRINKVYSGKTHHGVEDLIKDLKATRDLVDNKKAFAELLANHRNSALDPSNQEYNKRISEILKENPSDRALHLANSIMRRVGNSIYDVHTFDNKLRKFIDSSFVKEKAKSIDNPRPLHDLYDADLRDKDNNDLWLTAGSRPLTQEELNTIEAKIQQIQEEIQKLKNTEKTKVNAANTEAQIQNLNAQANAYEFLRDACAFAAKKAANHSATDIPSTNRQIDFSSTYFQKFFGNAEDGGHYIGVFSYVPKITQSILKGDSADVARYLNKLNGFLNSQRPEVKVQKNIMNEKTAKEEYELMRAILRGSFGKNNCSQLEQLLNATFDSNDEKNTKIFDSLNTLQDILKDAKEIDDVITPQNNASSEAESSGNTNTQPSSSEANTSDSRATTEASSNARGIDAFLTSRTIDFNNKYTAGLNLNRVHVVESTDPSYIVNNYQIYSGGALGADAEWGHIAYEYYGFNPEHIYHISGYSPRYNKPLALALTYPKKEYRTIPTETKQQQEAQAALKELGISVNSGQEPYFPRNYWQVANSDSVIAISSEPLKAGATYMSGGTNCAVQVARKLGKPVYIYDAANQQWFHMTNNGLQPYGAIPILTPRTALVGSRGNKLSPKAQPIYLKRMQEAMRNVFDATLNQQSVPAPEPAPTPSTPNAEDSFGELIPEGYTPINSNRDPSPKFPYTGIAIKTSPYEHDSKHPVLKSKSISKMAIKGKKLAENSAKTMEQLGFHKFNRTCYDFLTYEKKGNNNESFNINTPQLAKILLESTLVPNKTKDGHYYINVLYPYFYSKRVRDAQNRYYDLPVIVRANKVMAESKDALELYIDWNRNIINSYLGYKAEGVYTLGYGKFANLTYLQRFVPYLARNHALDNENIPSLFVSIFNDDLKQRSNQSFKPDSENNIKIEGKTYINLGTYYTTKNLNDTLADAYKKGNPPVYTKYNFNDLDFKSADYNRIYDALNSFIRKEDIRNITIQGFLDLTLETEALNELQELLSDAKNRLEKENKLNRGEVQKWLNSPIRDLFTIFNERNTEYRQSIIPALVLANVSSPFGAPLQAAAVVDLLMHGYAPTTQVTFSTPGYADGILWEHNETKAQEYIKKINDSRNHPLNVIFKEPIKKPQISDNSTIPVTVDLVTNELQAPTEPIIESPVQEETVDTPSENTAEQLTLDLSSETKEETVDDTPVEDPQEEAGVQIQVPAQEDSKQQVEEVKEEDVQPQEAVEIETPEIMSATEQISEDSAEMLQEHDEADLLEANSQENTDESHLEDESSDLEDPTVSNTASAKIMHNSLEALHKIYLKIREIDSRTSVSGKELFDVVLAEKPREDFEEEWELKDFVKLRKLYSRLGKEHKEQFKANLGDMLLKFFLTKNELKVYNKNIIPFAEEIKSEVKVSKALKEIVLKGYLTNFIDRLDSKLEAAGYTDFNALYIFMNLNPRDTVFTLIKKLSDSMEQNLRFKPQNAQIYILETLREFEIFSPKIPDNLTKSNIKKTIESFKDYNISKPTKIEGEATEDFKADFIKAKESLLTLLENEDLKESLDNSLFTALTSYIFNELVNSSGSLSKGLLMQLSGLDSTKETTDYLHAIFQNSELKMEDLKGSIAVESSFVRSLGKYLFSKAILRQHLPEDLNKKQIELIQIMIGTRFKDILINNDYIKVVPVDGSLTKLVKLKESKDPENPGKIDKIKQLKKLDSKNSFSNYVLGALFEEKHVIFDGNVKVPRRNNDGMRVPGKMRTALKKYMEPGYVIDPEIEEFYTQYLGKKVDDDLTVRDYLLQFIYEPETVDYSLLESNEDLKNLGHLLGLDNPNKYIESLGVGIRARNNANIQALINIAEARDNWEVAKEDLANTENSYVKEHLEEIKKDGLTHVWFPVNPGNNYRCFQNGKEFNPNAQKTLTRYLMYRPQTIGAEKLDKTNKLILSYHLLQNFDKKPEKKLDIGEYIEKADKIIQALNSGGLLVELAKKDLKDLTTEDWAKIYENMEKAGLEVEIPVQILNILRTLKQLVKDGEVLKLTDDLSDVSISNYIIAETDGITNGAAIGLVTFLGLAAAGSREVISSKDWENLEKIGIFKIDFANGKPITKGSLYDAIQAKGKDAYEKNIFRDMYETVIDNYTQYGLKNTQNEINQRRVCVSINAGRSIDAVGSLLNFLSIKLGTSDLDKILAKLNERNNDKDDPLNLDPKFLEGLEKDIEIYKTGVRPTDATIVSLDTFKKNYENVMKNFLERNDTKYPFMTFNYGASATAEARDLLQNRLGDETLKNLNSELQNVKSIEDAKQICGNFFMHIVQRCVPVEVKYDKNNQKIQDKVEKNMEQLQKALDNDFAKMEGKFDITKISAYTVSTFYKAIDEYFINSVGTSLYNAMYKMFPHIKDSTAKAAAGIETLVSVYKSIEEEATKQFLKNKGISKLSEASKEDLKAFNDFLDTFRLAYKTPLGGAIPLFDVLGKQDASNGGVQYGRTYASPNSESYIGRGAAYIVGMVQSHDSSVATVVKLYTPFFLDVYDAAVTSGFVGPEVARQQDLAFSEICLDAGKNMLEACKDLYEFFFDKKNYKNSNLGIDLQDKFNDFFAKSFIINAFGETALNKGDFTPPNVPMAGFTKLLDRELVEELNAYSDLNEKIDILKKNGIEEILKVFTAKDATEQKRYYVKSTKMAAQSNIVKVLLKTLLNVHAFGKEADTPLAHLEGDRVVYDIPHFKEEAEHLLASNGFDPSLFKICSKISLKVESNDPNFQEFADLINTLKSKYFSSLSEFEDDYFLPKSGQFNLKKTLEKILKAIERKAKGGKREVPVQGLIEYLNDTPKDLAVRNIGPLAAVNAMLKYHSKAINEFNKTPFVISQYNTGKLSTVVHYAPGKDSEKSVNFGPRLESISEALRHTSKDLETFFREPTKSEFKEKFKEYLQIFKEALNNHDYSELTPEIIRALVTHISPRKINTELFEKVNKATEIHKEGERKAQAKIKEIKEKLEKQSKSKKTEKISKKDWGWYNNLIEKGITNPKIFTKEEQTILTEYRKFKEAFKDIAGAFVALQCNLTQLDLELAADDFNSGKAFTYKSTEIADDFSKGFLTDLNDIQAQKLNYPKDFDENLKAEFTYLLGDSRLHTILAKMIRKAPVQIIRLQQEFRKDHPGIEATIGRTDFGEYVVDKVIKPKQKDAVEGEADSLAAGSQTNYRSENSKDIKSLELTEENVLEVFDNLPTNSNVAGTTLCSDEHRAYLRDLMQTTMQGLKAVDMIVGETTDTNYGTAEIKNGKRKISIYKSIGNAIQKSGLPYSMQELMAHESTHLVWWTLDNTDPLFQELRRIFSVFKQEYFGKPELFMLHQYDITDPRYAIELEAAKKRMNYIFREAEDPIREFATFGLTNETMRGLLQRTADTLETKKTGFKGFLQTLADIFTRYVDKLFSKASNGKYSRTANLLSNLELVHNIAVERMSNHREVGLLAKTATVIDNTLEAADVKLKTVTSKLSKVPYVASLTSNGFGNYLKSGRFTSEIMAELGIDGSSSYLKRGILRATINHVANINKKRQQQIAVDSDAIRRAFHSQLDDIADLAITNGILRTDLQTLYDENDKVNSVNYIRRILTDSNYHAQELARIKHILANTTVNHGPALGHENVGAFLINSCNSLANYMINEKHLYDFCNHSNANQIGRLWGYSRLTQEFDLNEGLNERIANCNIYTTLKALDLLDPNQKQILANIANSEFITDSKNNGITYLIRYQETAIKNGYKDLGSDAAIKSLHKGYVQDKTNPYHRVLKVYNNNDFMELQKKGFVEYTNPNAETDPKAPYKKYMHSTIPVANGYVSGAIATINSKARGESIYNPDTLPAGMSLMAYRKHSASVFKQQHIADQKRFEQTIDYAYNNPNPTLHTILNKDGSISDLQESLPAEIKDTVLNRSSNFAELAARTNAAYSELEDSSKHNEALLKVLIQDAKDTEEERNQHPELFIAVGPEQTGLGLEAYALLPTNARTFLWREYFDESNNVLYVRKSVFSQIFGFSEKSLGQLADNDHVYNKLDLPLKFLNSFVHGLLGNKLGVSFEFIWRFLQSTGKDTIVVKNFITTFNNIRSNIILLKNQGCSLHDIIRSHIEGYKHISAYRQDLAKMAKIRNSIRYEDLTPDELSTKTKEYNSIKANLKANPMYDILRRGALTTLESDEAQVDYEILGNKFGDALAEMHKNILKSDNLGAKVLRNALMLHGSAFYQLAKDFASGSDTIAKWVMYKNDPRSKGTPEQRDAAFLDAAELFINYDIPTNEWVHLANQVGVLNFSKFMLRIGRPLLRQFRDKPARVMAYLIIRGILKGLGYNGLSNIDAYGAAAWSIDAWTRKISQGVTGGAVGSSMVTELPIVNTLS